MKKKYTYNVHYDYVATVTFVADENDDQDAIARELAEGVTPDCVDLTDSCEIDCEEPTKQDYIDELNRLVAENGEVKLKNLDIIVEQGWMGEGWDYYYALYIDSAGVHACIEGDEDNIECYDPISLNDLDEEKLKALLDAVEED